MKWISLLPVRYVAPLAVGIICAVIAIDLQEIDVQKHSPETNGEVFVFQPPPPPPESFIEGFFVTPGVLAGLPLLAIGISLDQEWLVQSGLVLGAVCCWYCMGWFVDRSRGLLTTPTTPAAIRWHATALTATSAILFPVGVLAGFRVGVHSCAIGAFPYWADLLAYGIFMFWITLGAYFRLLRWRTSKAEQESSALFHH